VSLLPQYHGASQRSDLTTLPLGEGISLERLYGSSEMQVRWQERSGIVVVGNCDPDLYSELLAGDVGSSLDP
jgi:hypothetical protein